MPQVQKGIYPIDWAIFIFSLLVTLTIGIYHAIAAGKHTTTSEYFLGDRGTGFLPASISLMASFFSAVAVLGFPAEAYMNGIMCWFFAGGATIALILSGIIFVPVLHPLKLTSVNEYLLRRYQSRFVAILGTLSSVTGMLLSTSICYFAPSTAIEAATGFPASGCIIVGSIITIIYTSIGGIKAVIWTDVFQTLLMFSGMITITTQAVLKAGGFSEIWRVCEEWGRLKLIDLNPDPTQRFTFWSVTIGLAFSDLNKFSTQQPAVQRFSAMPSLTKARLSVLGLAPLVTTIVSLGTLSGIGIFTFYTKLGCDPLRAGIINNPNQVIPHFLMETMNYPGVQGILLASLASASLRIIKDCDDMACTLAFFVQCILSTASSGLNSSAANLWKDIIMVKWPKMSEERNGLLIKLLVVSLGVLSTVLAFLLTSLGGTLTQMSVTITSACAGPINSLFLLGMFSSSTNWIGASAGAIAGFTFALWIGFGAYSLNHEHNFLTTTVANCFNTSFNPLVNLTEIMYDTQEMTTLSEMTTRSTAGYLRPLYSVSFLWIACFSTLVTLLVGFSVSCLSGKMGGQTVPPELLHPWVRSPSKNSHITYKYTNIRKNRMKLQISIMRNQGLQDSNQITQGNA